MEVTADTLSTLTWINNNNIFDLLRLDVYFQLTNCYSIYFPIQCNRRTVSAIQALLSSSAGYIVCQSSCRRSFLTASHFMSDGYAWFGAAYFIYDMWYMYKVYNQKLHDGSATARDDDDESTRKTPNNICLNSPVKISFLQFCMRNPVMIIHHTFLGSFGLLVIVVCIAILLPLVKLPEMQSISHFLFLFSVFTG